MWAALFRAFASTDKILLTATMSSMAVADLVPSITSPIARPAASPAHKIYSPLNLS